jgi:hypothetical protein
MQLVLAGAALTVVGVSCLYGSWKKRIAGGWWPVMAGWILLALSISLWSRASGAEFGTTVAILAPALVAWVLACFNLELRQRRRNRRAKPNADDAPAPNAPVDPRSLTRHLLLFLVTVPLSGAAAIFASVALSTLLPWSDLSEMVLAMILLPILWGCAAYWATADAKPLRPTLAILAAGSAAAAFLYL